MMAGIQVSAIPRSAGRDLAREMVQAVKRFYADPKNRADFEKWRADHEHVHEMRREV